MKMLSILHCALAVTMKAFIVVVLLAALGLVVS